MTFAIRPADLCLSLIATLLTCRRRPRTGTARHRALDGLNGRNPRKRVTFSVGSSRRLARTECGQERLPASEAEPPPTCSRVRGAASLAPWLVALLLTPAAVSASTLTLTWEPSVGPHVSGYLVYVGTTSGTYSQTHDTGSSTSWVFTNPIAGQQYCFAVAAYAPGPVVGPRSNEVCGYGDAPPVLLDPGNHISLVGEAVTLQLAGSDPLGQPVSYAATGLPPGLTLTPSTGFIGGAAVIAGTFQVRASVTDGTLTDSKTFIWVVESASNGCVPPLLSITSPTDAAEFTSRWRWLLLAGTATGSAAITQISWFSDRGGTGTVPGTARWMAAILLQEGPNIITVTVRDAAGAQSSRTIVVTWGG